MGFDDWVTRVTHIVGQLKFCFCFCLNNPILKRPKGILVKLYSMSAAPVGWGEFYFARRSPTDEVPPRYVCCGHKPRRDRRQCATHSADLTAPLIKNQSGFWPNQPPFPIVVIDIRRVPNPVPWAVPWLCAYFPCACARAPRLGAYCSHTPGSAIWAFPLFCGERGKK